MFTHKKKFDASIHLAMYQPPDTTCLEEPGLVDNDRDRVESLGMLQGIAANFSSKASWIQKYYIMQK